MITQVLTGAYQHPLRVVDSADFDGTSDEMTRGGGLTGAADSKTGILSSWIRLDGGAGADRLIFGAANGMVGFYWLKNFGSPYFSLALQNATPTTILHIYTPTSYTVGATWLHFLASWDLAATASHLYMNDVSDKTESIMTNDTIDYTDTEWYFGGNGAVRTNGCIAEFYFAPGQYLDFSLASNRRKFISQSGKPVHLGSTGSLPTGTAPLVYFHLDDAEAVANFATNRGTGGDFTITGTLATGSNSPSD